MAAQRTKRIPRIIQKPLMPVGESDFKQLLEQGFYYIDKTLFIQEMLPAAKARVVLICRPRRFGKTLNMTMLRYFFERTEKSNAHLFTDKKIGRNKQAMQHQGQYPVIFLTFKEIKGDHWQHSYDKLRGLIKREYERHRDYIEDVCSHSELKAIEAIIDEKASQAKYEESLKFLADLLYRKSGKQVCFLLDEYDTPITDAYQCGYYDQMIKFLRALLGAALKDAPSMGNGVITGISRIAKEGIFSDLNNLQVVSVLQEKYADKFGFTHEEVKELLTDYKLQDQAKQIKAWFDGYSIGKKKNMYNPWSVIKCVDAKGILQPHWGLTSSNDLIKDLVLRGGIELKQVLEQLMLGQTVTRKIEAGIIFPGIKQNVDAVWNLLLYTGYVTFADHYIDDDGNDVCALKLPNKEMYVIFKRLIESLIISAVGSSQKFVGMLEACINGNTDYFAELLEDFVIKSVGQFDVTARTAENAYHMLLLGMMLYLDPTHIVKSNREAGYGRFDIYLIPRDSKKTGVIIELKKAKKKESLPKLAGVALQQIKNQKYAKELESHGVKNILAYGIAFEGKKLAIKMEAL